MKEAPKKQRSNNKQRTRSPLAHHKFVAVVGEERIRHKFFVSSTALERKSDLFIIFYLLIYCLLLLLLLNSSRPVVAISNTKYLRIIKYYYNSLSSSPNKLKASRNF